MSQELEDILKQGYTHMDDAVDHLGYELSKVRAGKATPDMVNGLKVDYYGSPTPLPSVANVSVTDSRTISIQPWEKNMLGTIEKAIFEANLGFTPMNNGEIILITIPPLTTDRRAGLVKNAKALGEDAKISLRTVRQKLMDAIKKEVKDGYPEDLGKRKEAEVQKNIEVNTQKIDKLIEAKEADIMKV
jgi:ribosome recycling factor